MITIRSEPRYLCLTGDPAEVMLYYCVWQTSLWPDWMKYELNPKHDPIKQHVDVVKTVADGGELMLACEQPEYVKAAGEALRLCSKFGVEITVTGRTTEETLKEVHDRIKNDTTVDEDTGKTVDEEINDYGN